MAIESSELLFDNRINSFLTVITILVFIVIIICFVFSSVSGSYYESISKIMEKQVDSQVSYYKKINALTDDLREFRHDYKNHMICIQSLIEKGQSKDAVEYLKSITKQEIIESNKFFSGNQIADYIKKKKNELALANGSQISFDGFISDEIHASDLCIILSNALDNAVEACAKTTGEDTKNIVVKCAVIQGIQIIQITNPNLTECSISETSKDDKENHGFGLYNIRRTVENLGGQMKIPSITPKFVLELEFPIKK